MMPELIHTIVEIAIAQPLLPTDNRLSIRHLLNLRFEEFVKTFIMRKLARRFIPLDEHLLPFRIIKERLSLQRAEHVARDGRQHTLVVTADRLSLRLT